MIKTLIRFETKNWLSKPSTIILLALWAVLLVFALSNGRKPVSIRQNRFDSLQVLQNERLAKHPAVMDSFETGKKIAAVYWDDARNAYDIGYILGKKFLFKHNQGLAPVAIGQSYLHHSDHALTTAAEFWFSALRKAERMDNPANLIYGTFDLAFVLVWLLPLITIVFTYNVLSSEREQGTLKMLLTHGLNASKLLFTRISYRYAVLVLVTLAVVCSTLAVVDHNKAFPGYGYFALLTILYALLWHSVAFLVNLFNRSSNYNAGVLFTLWMATTLVIPSLLNVIVTSLRPIPGKVILIDEVREKLTENDQKNSEILDQFYTDHPEFVIKDSAKLMPLFMYKYMIKEMTTSEQLQPIMDDYKNKMEAQSKAINLLATVVPAMACQEALEEISGHSLSQYLAFERFADQASRDWRNYFHPISLANKYLTAEEFRNLPDPVFITSIDHRKNTILLLALVLWNIVVFTLIYTRIRNYTAVT